MANKKITNEELCTAMLTHGTVREVANSLDISERTVYSMMQNNEFKYIYRNALNDILRNTVNVCRQKMTEAIEVMAEIMTDREINPQTRLQASTALLKNSVMMMNLLDTENITANDELFSVL